jgi:hypothetical protein
VGTIIRLLNYDASSKRAVFEVKEIESDEIINFLQKLNQLSESSIERFREGKFEEEQQDHKQSDIEEANIGQKVHISNSDFDTAQNKTIRKMLEILREDGEDEEN